MPDQLLQVLEIRWKELRNLRKDVLGQWLPEDIHDLRVATRRFRSILQLVEPLCHRRRLRTLRRVRRLTGKLDPLRNPDEAIGFFTTRLGEGELVEQLGRMNDLIIFERLAAGTGIDAGQRSAVEKLVAEEQERLFSEWQTLVAAEPLGFLFHMPAGSPGLSGAGREQAGTAAPSKDRS